MRVSEKDVKAKGEVVIFNRGLSEAYTISNVISWDRIPTDSKNYHHYHIITEDDRGTIDTYEVPADTIVSLPNGFQNKYIFDNKHNLIRNIENYSRVTF